MTPVDRHMHAVIRAAVDAEADAAPSPGEVWARTRRRLARRRAGRVVGSAAVAVVSVAVVSVSAWMLVDARVGDTVFGDPAVPSGWRDVEVGAALVSLPPGWEVVDGRGGREEPCPVPGTPTLWVRHHPGAGVPSRCSGEPLAAVQVAPLGHALHAVFRASDGSAASLGAVPAWRVPHETVEVDEEERRAPPQATVWLAPAVGLWVHVPGNVDAGEVLDTIRPATDPEPNAVVLLVAERGMAMPGERVEYAAVDALGRLIVWHSMVADDEFVASSYTLPDWAGLAPDRFALVEATTPQGVRVVAGRPDGGQVVWEESEAARDLTQGSFPQAAWSPDGTAVVWYAPRTQPVMGIVQWSDVDALADGRPPVWEQTVTVDEGPVQADPPVLRWTVEADGSVVSLARGVAPPWDPAQPESARRSYRWELTIDRDVDGLLKLPDPASFTRTVPDGQG